MSVPEDIFITIAEVEPILPVCEHVQREKHRVQVSALIDNNLASLLLPLITALDTDDVPYRITS